MNQLFEKSQQNLNAGELLLAEEFYASSVHCFYYSCIQLMKSKLIENYDYTDEAINDILKNARTGFHNWIINTVSREINNSSKRLNFRRKINLLKKLRIDSDYMTIEINQENGTNAKNYSEQVINILLKEI